MYNIDSQSELVSGILSQRLEDKIVDDINRLRVVTVDLEFFFRYIFQDCCNCLDNECDIVELRGTNLDKIMRFHNKTLDKVELGSCNNINIDVRENVDSVYKNLGSLSKSKIALAIKFIELFQANKLINRRQNTYFLLNGNMKLRWNNIKGLNIKDINDFKKENGDIIDKISNIYTGGEYKLSDVELVLMIKSLFWYFRKVIVDSIISDIIRMDNLKIVARSVGSTKISSDYDITLDGTYKSNAWVIKRYNRFIDILFMDDSERVFDTNVYGVSFIRNKGNVITPGEEFDKKIDLSNRMIMDAFDKEHLKCGKFDYILSDDLNFVVSQHIWALIKMLLKLNEVQNRDEGLSDVFMGDLSKYFGENIYYKAALDFINKYDSNTDYYQETVNDINDFLSKSISNNKDKEDIKYVVSNFISYVNYNGSETYLTNGAFLDVVVNNQMCKNNENIIKLDFNSYLDSFIENLSDLMKHYQKVKYLDRARAAFKNMLSLGEGFDQRMSCEITIKNFNNEIICQGIKLSDYVNKILETIGQLQMECSRDILECQSFIMIYYSLHCIIVVFRRYLEWSNISEVELRGSIDRFIALKFKDFKVPIESKIRDLLI